MTRYGYLIVAVIAWCAGCGRSADDVQGVPTGDPAKPLQPEKAPARFRPSSEDTSPVTPKADKASPSKRPNVVMVLLDTLRPDYLGFMGNDDETAPFLAELAAESAVFENALSSSSWTAPSVASLFTGLYPPQHTVVLGFLAHRGMIEEMKETGSAELKVNHIPPDLSTLSEMFEKAGYRTFGLASNINIGEEIGFSRGFERFEKHVREPAETLFAILSTWHEEVVEQSPFFLYLHFNDVHVPYHLRKPFFRPEAAESDKDDAAERYRSEIGYVDHVLRKVRQLPGLTENTVWVVVSDHGEEFWDHGGTEHRPSLYGELQRVLMMIHGPSHGIRPGRFKENTSLIDILPTMASLIGAPLEKEREGVSLLPLLRGGDGAQSLSERLRDRCLFGHRMASFRHELAIWSVTCGRYKLIDWWEDRQALFDVVTDRGERRNLMSKKRKTAEELFARLGRFKARAEGGETTSEQKEIELDEDLLKTLRALGYVE